MQDQDTSQKNIQCHECSIQKNRQRNKQEFTSSLRQVQPFYTHRGEKTHFLTHDVHPPTLFTDHVLAGT